MIYHIAVACHTTEWHEIDAPTAKAALEAYNDDRSKLLTETVDSVEGVRVFDPATHADVTISAMQPTVQ